MANKPVQPDPEEQHSDLLATLAAGRELGPEMDKALAESYIQRHPELVGKQAQQQQAVVAQPEQQRSVSPDMIGLAGMAIGLVAYLALLQVSGGALWWMFWPLMGWFGWRWGWGRWAHGGIRDEVRQARYQARVERYRARAAHYASYYSDAPRAQVPQPQQESQAQPQVSAPAPVQAQSQPPAPVPTPVTPSTPQPAQESRPSDVPPLNPAG